MHEMTHKTVYSLGTLFKPRPVFVSATLRRFRARGHCEYVLNHVYRIVSNSDISVMVIEADNSFLSLPSGYHIMHVQKYKATYSYRGTGGGILALRQDPTLIPHFGSVFTRFRAV